MLITHWCLIGVQAATDRVYTHIHMYVCMYMHVCTYIVVYIKFDRVLAKFHDTFPDQAYVPACIAVRDWCNSEVAMTKSLISSEILIVKDR